MPHPNRLSVTCQHPTRRGLTLHSALTNQDHRTVRLEHSRHVAPLDRFLKPIPWHETSTCCSARHTLHNAKTTRSWGSAETRQTGCHFNSRKCAAENRRLAIQASQLSDCSFCYSIVYHAFITTDCFLETYRRCVRVWVETEVSSEEVPQVPEVGHAVSCELANA